MSRWSGPPKEVALRSLAGEDSGFEEGRRRTPVDIVGGSPRSVRESLTSYLFPFSQPNLVPVQSHPVIGFNSDPLLTPPSSFSTPNLHMTSQRPIQPNHAHSLPLTPTSSSSPPELHSAGTPHNPTVTTTFRSHQPIPLITSLFPYQASQVASMSTVLEVVTPPDHTLMGFICDHPNYGRTVYVHLPPPHILSHRPETLSANFSEVLRPHDPSRSPRVQSSSPLEALDIRESLTALLDLASDSLQAKNLILVLDKHDRETEGLNELLHSLMYVGGQVVKDGCLDGGWDWDPRKWVLVGMEL